MSTVSIQQQMRALVDQYETGLLDQEDYRRLRRGLLDRAAKGEYAAPELSNLTRPREAARAKPAAAPPPSEPGPPEPPVERPRKERTTAPEPGESVSGGSGKWVALGAVAVVLIAAGWWFSQSDDTGTTQEPVVTDVPDEAGPMEELVTNFMQVDDWTPRATRQFTLRWQDFTPQQRAQAESSIWYRRFVRDLRDRLSLAELASESVANDRAVAISTLASEMGIDVESRFADSRDVSAVKAAAIANNRAAAERKRKLEEQQQQDLQSTKDDNAENQEMADNSRVVDTAVDESAPEAVPKNVARQKELETPSTALSAVATDDGPGSTTGSSSSTRDDAAPESTSKAVPVSSDEAAPLNPTGIGDDESSEAATQVAVQTVENDEPSPDANENKAASTAGLQSSGCNKGQLSTRLRYCRDVMADGTKGPKMALVRSGSFRMGSEATGSEQPVRSVNISYGFAVGVTEVSASEYGRFCAATNRTCPDNPWASGSLPIVNVSYDDAVAYTAWLSTQTGERYRLPTEAEWEYATRAGSDTEYPFGDELTASQAHFSPLRRQSQPLPVNSGRPPANKFGLKHSIGNVSEWVEDAWHDDYSGAPVDGSAYGSARGSQGVVRGGSYADRSAALRSAARTSTPSTQKNIRTGFRVVRELD